MKTLLVLSAALGLSISAAGACDYHKSAQADHMTVASIDADTKPMTVADDAAIAPAEETPAVEAKPAK